MKADRREQLAALFERIGVDPEKALGAPPTIDQVSTAPARAVEWVGKVNPEYEYYRASSMNDVELSLKLETEGYVACADEVTLAGCSTSNDVILMRRRDTAIAIEREQEAARERARMGILEAPGKGDRGAEATQTTQRRSATRRVSIHEKQAAA